MDRCEYGNVHVEGPCVYCERNELRHQRDALLDLAERIALDLEYELRDRYADDSGSGAIDIRHEGRWNRDMADVRSLRALAATMREHR